MVNVKFSGKVSLADADLDDLLFGCGSNDNVIQEISLKRTIIRKDFHLIGCKINKLEASDFKSIGVSTFHKTIIELLADFRNAKFNRLNIIDVRWPGKGNILLDGLSYEGINSGDEPNDWRNLLKFLQYSRFSAQLYNQLETYFKNCGHKDRANVVFMTMKQREGEMAPEFSGRRLWNSFLRWTVGYGRKPGRAFLLIALLLCLGIAAFWNPQDMVQRRIGHEADSLIAYQSNTVRHLHYDPVLYSLDLLLPVDLGVAKHWEPNPDWRIGWYYSKFHMICGWVLISILVAKFTGIIGKGGNKQCSKKPSIRWSPGRT